MEKDKEFTVARLILRMANQIVKNRNLHVKALGLTTEQADSLLFFLSHENAVINDLRFSASPTRPPGASSSAWRGNGW